MSTTSNTVVRSALHKAGLSSVPVGYERYVSAVESAIDEARKTAADSLRATARREGLASATVERALVNAGLADPRPVTPPPSAAPATPDASKGAIASALEAVARALRG